MNSTEIAKLAGVSRSTVSRVINGHAGVSSDTRKKIEEIIEKYNYYPDSAARNLVGKTCRTLGLVILDTEDMEDEYTICRSPFYSEYIAYAIDFSQRYHYDLLVSVARNHSSSEILKLLSSNNVAGLILMGDTIPADVMNRLCQLDLPVVLYNEKKSSPSDNIIVVNYDDFRCGKMAGDALIAKGHRKIAIATGSKSKICPAARNEGIIFALKNAGISFDEENYLRRGNFHRSVGGYEATKQLLHDNAGHLPTAICVTSSIMMFGAIDAIHAAGLHIPEDISLIGIDGNDLSCYANPSLSEVRISVKSVAKLTVTKLIEFLENDGLEQLNYEISEADLILRDSIRSLSRPDES